MIGLAADTDGNRSAYLIVGGASASVPFAWSPGRIYGLAVYSAGPGTWRGAVYDYASGTWTAIGERAWDGAGSTLLPLSRTQLRWQGGPADSCSAFPLDDTYVTPPIGMRAGGAAVGTELAPYVVQGDCPFDTTYESGWNHYRLGSAA